MNRIVPNGVYVARSNTIRRRGGLNKDNLHICATPFPLQVMRAAEDRSTPWLLDNHGARQVVRTSLPNIHVVDVVHFFRWASLEANHLSGTALTAFQLSESDFSKYITTGAIHMI